MVLQDRGSALSPTCSSGRTKWPRTSPHYGVVPCKVRTGQRLTGKAEFPNVLSVFRGDTQVRSFSQLKIDAYTCHVGRFAEFLGKATVHAVHEDVRPFQLHLIAVRKAERYPQVSGKLNELRLAGNGDWWHRNVAPFVGFRCEIFL